MGKDEVISSDVSTGDSVKNPSLDNGKQLFSTNESALHRCEGMIYDVKVFYSDNQATPFKFVTQILKSEIRSPDKGKPEELMYRIHFKNYHKRHDKWIKSQSLLKDTPENKLEQVWTLLLILLA